MVVLIATILLFIQISRCIISEFNKYQIRPGMCPPHTTTHGFVLTKGFLVYLQIGLSLLVGPLTLQIVNTSNDYRIVLTHVTTQFNSLIN